MPVSALLSHVTHYVYDRPVRLGPQLVRLRPTEHCRTPIEGYLLDTDPKPSRLVWQRDWYGNHEARLEFEGSISEFKVTVELGLELAPGNPWEFPDDGRRHELPFRYNRTQARALQPYMAQGPAPQAVQAYLGRLARAPRSVMEHASGLNQLLHRDIFYRTRMEEGVQTPEQTLKLASGSCRDSGWLLVHLLRQSGLAARFVSGYLVQLQADADSAGLHAWCELYLPEAGWIGLDPTSGLLASTDHIPLACTPEPGAAAPVQGHVSRSQSVLAHHMSLTRRGEPSARSIVDNSRP